jgi:hypothetical protein
MHLGLSELIIILIPIVVPVAIVVIVMSRNKRPKPIAGQRLPASLGDDSYPQSPAAPPFPGPDADPQNPHSVG